jgi:hypothetical protein
MQHTSYSSSSVLRTRACARSARAASVAVAALVSALSSSACCCSSSACSLWLTPQIAACRRACREAVNRRQACRRDVLHTCVISRCWGV